MDKSRLFLLCKKKYAYGISSTLIDKDKESFKVNLIGYPKKDIYLLKANKNEYHAYINVDGNILQLQRIFFKTEGGSFFKPNIVSIEVTGKDIKTNHEVSEQFKP